MLKHFFKSSVFRNCMVLLALVFLNMLAPFLAWSQDMGSTVSGTISDAAGPVVGAAVMIKGSAGGVTSDLDGAFSLSGLSSGDVMVVSILGYKTQEIVYSGQQRVDIMLEVSTEYLDEVVVTALGIKREEKALSYNVQQVDSEQLTAVKDANFVNSLAGKVAGVTINSGPSAAALYGNAAASGVVNSGFNPRDFYNTGANVITSASLSTGNAKNQTYISVSSTNSTGIIPTAHTFFAVLPTTFCTITNKLTENLLYLL